VNITADEWPKVEVIHQALLRPSASEGRISNGERFATSQAIGPFVSGRELRKTLRALRKILPYKTCKNPYEKPCLQWHIGLCPAHAPQTPSTPSRQTGFRSGNKFAYLNSLHTLRQLLRLYAREPIRVEAYDISNIQGVYATGSMIVFYDSKPEKSQYRKFRIKTVPLANDTAMIKEVLARRFNHPEWPFPDLILIDGGKAQLSAAVSQLKYLRSQAKLIASSIKIPDIAVISLAKREEEIYTEYSGRALKISNLPEALRLLFKHVRDEAHRFAVFYYRFLHGRQFSQKTSRRDRKKARKS
jgi:excinuclease UvrABC nuclease subunit